MSSLKIYGNFAFLVTSAVCMARPGSHTTILLSMFPKTGWQCRHKQAKAGNNGWYNVKRDVTSASKRSIRMFVITEKAPTRAFSWLKAAVLNKMWMYLKCLPLLVTTQCCRPARWCPTHVHRDRVQAWRWDYYFFIIHQWRSSPATRPQSRPSPCSADTTPTRVSPSTVSLASHLKTIVKVSKFNLLYSVHEGNALSVCMMTRKAFCSAGRWT